MKSRLLIVLLTKSFWLTGCFLNQPESVQNLVKDFNLGWQGDAIHQALYVNIDHTEYGGLKVVDETVFAVGWNQDFIIALQQTNGTLANRDTVYHIIDIRDYSQRFWGPRDNVYVLDNTLDYQQKKQELGVPDLEMKPAAQLN